jgi:hypothetical protein
MLSQYFLKRYNTGPLALASMRIVHGSKKNLLISNSIGSSESSIPMHRLLQSFSYPKLKDFNPFKITETQVCECSRRAALNKREIIELVKENVMTKEEGEYFLQHCFNHLLVGLTRYCVKEASAFVFNLRPYHAYHFKSLGLNLVPLFSEGVEPTKDAIDERNVLSPLFTKWTNELQKCFQQMSFEQGIASAIKEIYKSNEEQDRAILGWKHCNIPLPFLLLIDKKYHSTVQRVENLIAKDDALYNFQAVEARTAFVQQGTFFKNVA